MRSTCERPATASVQPLPPPNNPAPATPHLKITRRGRRCRHLGVKPPQKLWQKQSFNTFNYLRRHTTLSKIALPPTSHRLPATPHQRPQRPDQRRLPPKNPTHHGNPRRRPTTTRRMGDRQTLQRIRRPGDPARSPVGTGQSRHEPRHRSKGSPRPNPGRQLQRRLRAGGLPFLYLRGRPDRRHRADDPRGRLPRSSQSRVLRTGLRRGGRLRFTGPWGARPPLPGTSGGLPGQPRSQLSGEKPQRRRALRSGRHDPERRHRTKPVGGAGYADHD